MSKTGEPPITYEEAKRRALTILDEVTAVYHPSTVADAIWPKHRMKRQGAAFAASAILKRMKADGVVRWRIGVFEGWVKSIRPLPQKRTQG